MRYIGFEKDEIRYVGIRQGDVIRSLGTMDAFYRNLDGALRQDGGETFSADSVRIVPPVPRTSRIFCVGINYLDHAREADEAANIELPKYPMVFGRWANTLVVDGTPVPVPPNEQGLDWEVELALVIGKTTWLATEANAMDSVLGYTVFNDISARKKQLETRQFTLGKNSDFSGPIGPVVVTKDEIEDANNLRVTAKVNGKTMQDANTRDLIHSIPRIISYITDTVTLEPGDVVATGTPGGVGVGMKPPVYMTHGDVVEVEVEGIGVLRNPIVCRVDPDVRVA
jgi:2-keto-4-pentenoate hydratase/2-oxohepta-3-ene-1,7-dioic acid hydratase in catechol pathway